MPSPTTRSIKLLPYRAALLLAMSCGFGGVAYAQVLVTDTVAITAAEEGFKSQLVQTVAQYTRQGMELATQLDQYRQQIQQYQEVLTSIQGLATGGISLTSGRLTPIGDASNLVRQACPGATGSGVLESMTSVITSTFDNSITKNQQIVCTRIVLTQIHKYNLTVKMVNSTQKFGEELQDMAAAIKGMTTQGDSTRVAANASAHSEQLVWEMQEWRSQMEKDDAIILTLQQQQGILAKLALNGSSGILGDVVQAAAFAAAFR